MTMQEFNDLDIMNHMIVENGKKNTPTVIFVVTDPLTGKNKFGVKCFKGTLDEKIQELDKLLKKYRDTGLFFKKSPYYLEEYNMTYEIKMLGPDYLN